MGAPWNKPTSPGWYPDPSGHAVERYYNGVGWTVHRRELPTATATAPVAIQGAAPAPEPGEQALAQPNSGRGVLSSSRRRLLNRVLTLVAICSFGGWLGVWVLLALTAFLN